MVHLPGVDWSRVNWSGVNWSGVDSFAVDKSGVDCSRVNWSGVKLSGVGWSEVNWQGGNWFASRMVPVVCSSRGRAGHLQLVAGLIPGSTRPQEKHKNVLIIDDK